MTEEDLLKLKREAARLEKLLDEIASYERVICNLKSHPELLRITIGSIGSPRWVGPPEEISEKIILLLETHLAKLKKQFEEA